VLVIWSTDVRLGKEHTRCTLRLPCPENPAVSLLVCHELGLGEALDVGSIGVAETLDGASILSVA
jgi:hypothetical protein